MGNINESKKAFLEGNDLTQGTLAWRGYLDSQGFTSGSIVEDTKAFLISIDKWVGNMPESLVKLYEEGEGGVSIEENLIHYLPVSEGSGLVVADTITAAEMDALEGSINWQSEDIIGYTNRPYILAGAGSGFFGAVEGTLITSQLTTYTLTCLVRMDATNTGAVFRQLSTPDPHLRSTGWKFDYLDSNITTAAHAELEGVWVRLTLVQDATHQRIYINKTEEAELETVQTIDVADTRLGAFDTSNPFPGCWTDFRIYDVAIGQEVIDLLVDNDIAGI